MIKTSVTDTAGKTCMFTLVLLYYVRLFHFNAAHRQTAAMTFFLKTVLTESNPVHVANWQEMLTETLFLFENGWGLKRCKEPSCKLATSARLLSVGLDNNWQPLTHQP